MCTQCATRDGGTLSGFRNSLMVAQDKNSKPRRPRGAAVVEHV